MAIYCYSCGKNLSEFKGIKKCVYCKTNLTIFDNKNVPIEQEDDDIESRIVRKVIVKKQLTQKQKDHLKKMHENNRVKRALKKAEEINTKKNSKNENSKISKKVKKVVPVQEESEEEYEEEVQTQAEIPQSNPYNFLF
jgi:hypothetical protein